MDNEKLKKGIALHDQIKELERILNIWEKAQCISTINITFTNIHDGISTENLKPNYIDFEVLKTLTINSIKKHLWELKNEYSNL